VITAYGKFVRQLWFAIGCGLVGLIVYLSLASGPDVPMTLGLDKLGHGLAYGTLMLWFAQLYERPRWALVALACMLLGVALEYLQGFTIYRTFSYVDMVANLAGVVVGLTLALAGVDNCIERVERWVYGTPA
jgi:VanZ family protein